MKVRPYMILLALLCAANAYGDDPAQDQTQEQAKEPKTVKITISPETTYVTEPLLPDGRVDYYGALNRLLSDGVTPENNMAAGIFSLIPGEKEFPLLVYEESEAVWNEVQDYRQRYWQHLGFDAPPDLESLQFAYPRTDEGKELEFLLKYYTPEEIIARLYEDNRPKDKDVDPLDYLRDVQKNNEWWLRQAISSDWYDVQSRLWMEKDYPLLADWMPTADELERRLIEVSKRPKFYNPIITNSSNEDTMIYSVVLPYVQATREVARFMLIRGNWHFTHGDHDKAFECAFASQRVGLAIRTNNAFIVEDLVGVAICSMSNYQIMTYLSALEGRKDAAWLNAKRAEYAAILKAYVPPEVPQWITWERCGMLSAVQAFCNRPDDFVQMMKDNNINESEKQDAPMQRLLQMMSDHQTDYDWDKVLRLINGYFDEKEDMLHLPGRFRKKRAYDRLEKRLAELTGDLATRSPDSDPERFIADCMYSLFCPSIWPAIDAITRREFDAKAVDVCFALAAYRADQGGYPETLDQLVPKYLAEIPVSPFSGKPIRYFKQDNMLLLSSGDDYMLDGSDEALEKLIAERCGNEPHSRALYLALYEVTAPIIILRY